jgi:hypothetical protein
MRSLLPLSTVFLLTAALAGTATAASADGSATEVGTIPGAVHRATPPPAARAGTPVVIGTTGALGANFVFHTSNVVTLQVGLAPGSPSYTVPGAGVLTSVSHDEGSTGGTFRALFFGPSTPATTKAVLGFTPKLTSVANTLNTYPVQIPVSAGTILGLWIEAASQSGAKSTANAADTYKGTQVDPTTISFYDTSGATTNRLVNISAVWEPDVDGDGFGDVSQDLCPQSAAAHSACPAPDTRIKGAPKATPKRKIKISFESSIPGSTFTCAIDGKAPKPCTSPLRKRYSLGKHKLLVTATSPLGVVEVAPAKVKFRRIAPRH